ncbi:MAG: type I-C CRISPR-associated protein Cas8c/Csd1 [Gammaproteobacteria bacterium]
MILQALNDYYQRKMADPDPARRLPPFGFESKEIPFILELSPHGTLVSITDTRVHDGKKLRAAVFLVPHSVKRAINISANLLWDTAEYAIGLSNRDKPDRLVRQHEAFRQRIASLPPAARDDEGVRAVLRFLGSAPGAAVAADRCGPEILAANPLVAFRMSGAADLICQRPAVADSPSGIEPVAEDPDAGSRTCLITGEQAIIERLHASIKGVWNAQSSGANIVSFNLDAFDSYGKKQGANAPVSERAAFCYTTALNHMLRSGSRQRTQVGDASTVFWAQRADGEDMEDIFAEVFGASDDPDSRADQVRALFESVRTGRFDGARGRERFFVLGLAPNAARIAVRFWHAAPLAEVAARIRAWFDDIAVVRGVADPEYPSLFRLLTAIAVLGKADNIPPNLGGEIMRSILTGAAYPATWLGAAVRRARAERNVTYYRAAAIKACLNRATHRRQGGGKEFQPMLDEVNPNSAYRLGRLFAVLERIQEKANPGINATIRDRYFGAASTSPVTVFTALLRLKNAHVKKLSAGEVVYFEKKIGEILDGVADFPRQLGLADQGRFDLGYYQQRQDFFRPKSTSQVEE